MPRQSITWLITDTHFYHDKIIEACGRPLNYNEKTIGNCRRLIAPQDLLIHLGDVIFYRYTELKALLDSFPCRKILTIGNHDRKSRNWYHNNGFDFAADTIQIDDVLLSHKPVDRLPSNVRLNIHGHWHNTRHHAPPVFYNDSQYRLLALEETDYSPVKLIDFAR